MSGNNLYALLTSRKCGFEEDLGGTSTTQQQPEFREQFQSSCKGIRVLDWPTRWQSCDLPIHPFQNPQELLRELHDVCQSTTVDQSDIAWYFPSSGNNRLRVIEILDEESVTEAALTVLGLRGIHYAFQQYLRCTTSSDTVQHPLLGDVQIDKLLIHKPGKTTSGTITTTQSARVTTTLPDVMSSVKLSTDERKPFLRAESKRAKVLTDLLPLMHQNTFIELSVLSSKVINILTEVSTFFVPELISMQYSTGASLPHHPLISVPQLQGCMIFMPPLASSSARTVSS
jgi:hypothetical protein